MEDTYTASPRPYGTRLCRAAGLVLLGAVIHTVLPQGNAILIPRISPLPIVRADAGAPQQPSLLVEHRTVFAPLVGGLRNALAPEAPVGTTGSVTMLASSSTGPAKPTVPALPRAAFAADQPEVSEAGTRLPVAEAVNAIEAIPEVPVLADPPAAAERIEPLPTSIRAAAVTAVSEETLVRRLLDEYAGAFERLDVSATKAVWPSVNDKALEKAYGRLASQRLTLQGCGITISGSTANARCQGSATYQPRIGKRAVVASREWTFDLLKKDAAWRIVALR